MKNLKIVINKIRIIILLAIVLNMILVNSSLAVGNAFSAADNFLSARRISI